VAERDPAGSCRQHRESLAAGAVTQTLIQAHKSLFRRPLVTPDERRGELERIGGAEGMRSQKTTGTLTKGKRRRHDVCVLDDSGQPAHCLFEWIDG